jgi:eukaryotic-like serine/threonine-protein kinase
MRCNPEALWTLVHQQVDPTRNNPKLFSHLESCSTCQQTLEDLAGGATWVEQASYWLAEDSQPDCGHASEDHDLASEDLSFLDAARHPEMLGRIGRYDIEGILGRGGMGLVLRGFDVELQRPVAIKVLAPEWAASTAAKQRFAREAQAAASVAHENVVPIYNVGADANPPYLVMRYIPGVTLQQLVDKEGPLACSLVIRIASQLSAGLSAAHSRGLVHRDVKPANVLVGENTDRVWLTDFGLARAADEARMTRTGVIAGTPHYMSPEQAKGQPLDVRSDWFSLGCLVYFACTGMPPFDAPSTLAILQQTITAKPKSLRRLRPDLPPSLIALVDSLLNKKPEKRPADFEAVDHWLRQADAEMQSGRGRFGLRRTWIAGMSVAACVLATGLWVASKNQASNAPASNTAASTSTGPLEQQPTEDGGEPAFSDPWDEPSTAGILHQDLVRSIDRLAGWHEAGFQQSVSEIEKQIEQLR